VNGAPSRPRMGSRNARMHERRKVDKRKLDINVNVDILTNERGVIYYVAISQTETK
jgi:hypothetical protein